MVAPNLAYWTVAQTGMVVPLARGNPGTAKTECIKAFGKAMGRPVYVLIGSLREPADIGGYPYPTECVPVTDPLTGKEVKVYMSLIAPKWAMDCWDGQDWIVFFDEATTCTPATQAAMLRIMAEKWVGDLPLPKNTWILSACNPPNQAAGGHELEPPMANRLCHLEWVVDGDGWDQGMMAGLSLDASGDLVWDFPEPQFPVLPADWHTRVAANGALYAAFRRARPTLFCDYPKDRSKAGGPWPSPRSWTNACVCESAMQSIGASQDLCRTVVAGCVGHDVAQEFYTWKRNLDLPDPEWLLGVAAEAKRNPTRPFSYAIPNRSDQMIALVGAVTDRVLNHGNTKERWEAGVYLLEQVYRCSKEIAVVSGKSLMSAYQKGYDIPTAFASDAYTLMNRTGMLSRKSA